MSQSLERPAFDTEWRSIIEPLLPVGGRLAADMLEPEDRQLRYELYRYIYSQISCYFIGRVHVSPEYPEFWPSHNEVFNLGYPNPDDVLYTAPIDSSGVYRLSGYRGTVKIMDLSIAGGMIVPAGIGTLGPTFRNCNFDNLSLDGNGYFEVIVSADRPAGHDGDWWPLHPDTTYFVIRQRMFDIQSEMDGRIAIERLDLPAIKPRQTADEIDRHLKSLAESAQGWLDFILPWLKRLHGMDLVNRMRCTPLTEFGGINNQHYLEGFFDIEEDEALVIETDIPDHWRYWNFQLVDFQWGSIGWMHSQSSINCHTARIDADGRLRYVVSVRDPGVANWLDTTGKRRGLLIGRWTECSSQPVPTVTRVKLADVRDRLPADTPSVSPEQRDAHVRRHRQAVQLRKKW